MKNTTNNENYLDKFDAWNEKKKKVEIKESNIFYINEREIWYVHMGKNVGFEEDGKENFLRPVLVIKKIGNLFLTIAMTSRGKENNFYQKLKNVKFNEENQKHANSSYIILSQIRVMDKKRFTENMGTLNKSEFESIKEKLKTFLF